MKKRNVILISLDEVRPDHLGCYGYDRLETLNIDQIAADGVLFESHIAAGCYTGICMASMITGVYPDKHTLRDPFGSVRATTAAQIFKRHGWRTAAFVGNGVLGEKHGFKQGFDFFKEPSAETSFNTWHPDESEDPFHIGYWWADDTLRWIQEHKSSPFFVWGHLFHTHRGGEVTMLKEGLLREGEHADLFYMDGKIKAADELIFGRFLQALKEWKLADRTTVIVTSDHGTNTGEHPATPFDYVIFPDDPEREAEAQKQLFPQHLNLFDVNVKTVLIVSDPELPKGIRVPGQVRSVDLLPTLLEMHDIPDEGFGFDGASWLPAVHQSRAEGRMAYLESLHEWESERNALVQALRTDEFKFIRNMAETTEQFYDLQRDPGEQHNIISQAREPRREELLRYRKILNQKILSWKTSKDRLSETDRQAIESRLRRLGYMR